MKKTFLGGLALVLLALPLVWIEPVARAAEPPASLQAVKDRMEVLDKMLGSVKSAVEGLRPRGEQIKETVGAKVKDLKAFAADPAKVSAELKRRVELFQTGEEAKELEALKDIEKLASKDEVLIAVGHAAKDSQHEAVRRRALSVAASLGDEGYPAIAIAYEALSSKDRVFLAKEMNKRKSADNVIFFALMSKEADAELMSTLLNLEFETSQRIVFFAAIAESQENNDAFFERMIDLGVRTEGDAGLLILYALAKSGREKPAAGAVAASVARKEAAWPVIAAAYKKEDKLVRAAVVRAAKKLGCEAGDFVIKTALADSNADLRAAAEEAVK